MGKENTGPARLELGHELLERASRERPYLAEWVTRMLEVAFAKGHDYATAEDPLSNMRGCTEIGLSPFLGVAVRMLDKWNRLVQFLRKGVLTVADESIYDTLIDLCNYSCFFCHFVKEEKG